MSAGAARPLAPLWARVVIAAGVALAIFQVGVPQGAAAPIELALLGIVAALARPRFSIRNAVAIGGAGATAATLARLVGGGEAAWGAACAGAAAALFPMQGEPQARPSLRAAGRMWAGAAVSWLAASLFLLAALPGFYRLVFDAGLAMHTASGIICAAFGATIAIAFALGSLLARRMTPALALALLAAVFAVTVLENGSIRRAVEVRLDTGDVRYYWLWVPLVPVERERCPEPDRTRLLDLARVSPALRRGWIAGALPADEEWRRCRGTPRLLERATRWITRDPRIALLLLEGLAANPARDEGLDRALASGDSWRKDPEIQELCAERGHDIWDPMHLLGHEPARLEAWLRQGVYTERAEAAARLGRLGARASLPALASALDDPAPEVRAAAATALGALGDRAALEALRAARLREQAGARGELPREEGGCRLEGRETLPALEAAIGRLEAGGGGG